MYMIVTIALGVILEWCELLIKFALLPLGHLLNNLFIYTFIYKYPFFFLQSNKKNEYVYLRTAY